MNHGLTSKALLVAALWAAAGTSAHAQWTIDYTVRYDAGGQQTGKPGERRGPDTLVAEKRAWRVLQEVRGTLAYSQKVRGAVASRMPDANNEQRYDSWLHRPGSAGKPAWLKLDAEEVLDSAAKLGQADGEGAGEINRQRAGKFGRVEHVRERITALGEGDGAARLAGAFLQIDRVEGKLHFEPPAVDLVSTQVRYAVEKVTRMDKPAAAGEWDQSGDKDGAQRSNGLRLPLLPVQVFDLPKDAESLEATRVVDVPGRIGGKATITIALRRAGGAAASAGAVPAAGTKVATVPTPANTAAAPGSDPCPPKPSAGSGASAADTGATVGGQVLGGGHGRQVGGAIGGFLGALGGAIKKPDTASADCAR